MQRRTSQLTNIEHPTIKEIQEFLNEQRQILNSVEVGGMFGTSLLTLDKPAIVNGEINVIKDVPFPPQADIRKDGLYHRGISGIDYNLQRFEQRILRKKQLAWFNRSNWQMRFNSDLTTHSSTKPVDVSLEGENPNIATQVRSAVLSHRVNAKKIKYYRLDLTIGTLKFTNHPLFCEEDHLAVSLQQQFRQYEERVGLCLVDHLQQRQDVLNMELQQAEDELAHERMNPSAQQLQLNQILLDRIELLKHHKEIVDQLLNQERALIQQWAEELYATWMKIREQRSIQNSINSSVKLQVREFFSDHQEYDFFLTMAEPSQTNLSNGPLPSKEEGRRRDVENTRIYLRILINGEFVAETQKQFLHWPKFEANINERFQLHLFTRPVKIQLQVCSGYRWRKIISLVEFEPPGLNVKALTSSATILKELNFIENDGKIDPNVEEIDEKNINLQKYDANINTVAQNQQQQQNKMTGTVTIKAEWVSQSQNVPPIRFEDLVKLRRPRAITIPEHPDLLVDINDPRNKEIILWLKKQRSSSIEEALRIDALFPHYKFVSLREILMKERYRSTKLSFLPVPLLERDIINHEVYMKFLRGLQDLKQRINKFHLFAIQRYRLIYSQDKDAKQRMVNLMEAIVEKQNQVRLGTHTTLHSTSSIIDEVQIIDTNAFANCMKIVFTPRRKLRPKRTEITAVSASTVAQSRIHIIVYKGNNIPVRDEAWSLRYPQVERFYQPIPPAYKNQRMGEPRPPDAYGYNRSFDYPGEHSPRNEFQPPPERGQGYQAIERVQSFIEVRLVHKDQSRVVRTAPFDGTNPEWNEMIELVFESIDGQSFTKEELQDCTSVLYFVLFDQILSVTRVIADRGEVSLRVERRYLGSFQLPMLTVFQNPQGVEATFRVQRPLCLFGYHTSKENPFIPFHEAGNSHAPPQLDPNIDTQVTLKVSLDPVLELPTEAESDFYPGFENPKFLFYANQWIANKKQNKKLMQRNFRVFAENFEGHSVFLPRFITPLEPPQGLYVENDPDKYNKVARFVKLIPFIEDNQAFKDLPDMWCDCQQLLDLGFGDFEEHALLLCNYFKWIAQNNETIKIYLLIGEGVPEGKTVYVVKRDITTNEVELWNASEGTVFSLRQENFGSKFLCFSIASGTRSMMNALDQVITLRSVGCLIDENDVYLNIQAYTDPFIINYDVNDEKSWSKFLGEGDKRTYFFPNNIITTIQKPLLYDYTPDIFAQELQLQIEDYIRQKFMEIREVVDLRRPLPTFWDQLAEQNMRQIMPQFELYMSQVRQGTQQEASLYGNQVDREYQNSIQLRQLQEHIAQMIGDQRNIYGFPINRALVTVEDIWEEVKNTDIHNIADEYCKFVLNVFVAPYPNFICSVWVYIAALFDDPYEMHGY